jgi:hypothetical protein
MNSFTQPSRTNDAIEVLQLTNDGDDLGPHDLSLLQSAVNGRLTEAGLAAFDKLHERCKSGAYQRPFLFGIEPLIQDLEGYVYYKQFRVEHYSFSNDPGLTERLRQDAMQLLIACRQLEAMNITPSISAVLSLTSELVIH